MYDIIVYNSCRKRHLYFIGPRSFGHLRSFSKFVRKKNPDPLVQIIRKRIKRILQSYRSKCE